MNTIDYDDEYYMKECRFGFNKLNNTMAIALSLVNYLYKYAKTK